jgi:hypothetical protein
MSMSYAIEGFKFECAYCHTKLRTDVPLFNKPYTYSCACGAFCSLLVAKDFIETRWHRASKGSHLKLVH